MAGFYSARGWTIPPLPWPTFAPPLSHLIAERKLPIRAGFIHLPDTPEHIAQVGSNGPSMDLRLQAAGLRIAIESALAHADGDLDIPVNEWEW